MNGLYFKKQLYTLILFFICVNGYPQSTDAGPCAKMSPIYKDPGLVPYPEILDTSKTFVLLSEIHYVSVNTAIQYHLISSMAPLGYRNILLEQPLSYSIIGNQYLLTGDTSYLALLARSCENLEFWKKIYAFNHHQPVSKQIRFWGMDFEIEDGRGRYFGPALDILISQKKVPLPIAASVEKLKKSPGATANLYTCRKMLQDWLHTDSAHLVMGPSYNLLKMLVERNTTFSKNRDKELYLNAKTIHESLAATDPGGRYLAELGIAHVNIANKESFVSLIAHKEDSPWKEALFIIGTHYINCVSNYRLLKETKVNLGLLDKKLQKIYASRDTALQSPYLKLVVPDAAGSCNLPGDMILLFFNYPGEISRAHCTNH
jgi:hypothetical protein